MAPVLDEFVPLHGIDRIHSTKVFVTDVEEHLNMSVGSKCPETVIPTWKTRHESVAKAAEKLIKRFPELTKAGMTDDDATMHLMRCSNENIFAARIVPGKLLSYNFKRVGRLRQPRAAALLARYAGFIAREAFDHDFGEREQGASIETANKANATPGGAEVTMKSAREKETKLEHTPPLQSVLPVNKPTPPNAGSNHEN